LVEEASKPMSRHLLVGAAIFVVAALAPAFAAAQATTSTTNVIIDETIPAENPCTGEVIVFTVRAHLLLHTTADANSGTHHVVHAHGQRVFGVSDTGTRYVGKIVATTSDQDNGSNPQNAFSDRFHFHVVSQGGSDNFVLEVRMHVTVTANGEVSATFNEFRAECRG
jgi:hypothetical protein